MNSKLASSCWLKVIPQSYITDLWFHFWNDLIYTVEFRIKLKPNVEMFVRLPNVSSTINHFFIQSPEWFSFFIFLWETISITTSLEILNLICVNFSAFFTWRVKLLEIILSTELHFTCLYSFFLAIVLFYNCFKISILARVYKFLFPTTIN